MKSLKTIGKTLAGIALMYNLGSAQTVEGVQSLDTSNAKHSYIRLNEFYALPGKIKGYAFQEFYKDGTVFGKNTLSREVYSDSNISAGAVNQTVYGSGMKTRTGIGAYLNVTISKGSSIKGYIIPYFVDLKTHYLKNRVAAGYSFKTELPLDLRLSGFGEWNLDTPKGAEWGYGELSLSRDIAKGLSLGYNPALRNREAGNAMPKLEHRLNISYTMN